MRAHPASYTAAQMVEREAADRRFRTHSAPRTVSVVLTARVARRPDDLGDGLRDELAEAVRYLTGQGGFNRSFGLGPGTIEFTASLAPVAEPERLRAVLVRIVWQHCGERATVEFVGLDVPAPALAEVA